MPDAFSFDIGSLGSFRSIEQAQTFGHAVRAYARLKPIFSLGYAKTARTISAMRGDLVLDVFGRRNIAQIFKTVIVAVSVYVVDVLFRPFTFRVKPNKTVRTVTLAVEPNDAVALVVYSPCNAADHYPTISFNAPAQNAGRQIADKQFIKTVARKHTYSPMVLSCAGGQFMSMVKAP